jgi:hypothetical protein
MKKQLPIFIVVVVVIAAISFFVGWKCGQGKKQNGPFGNNDFRQMVGAQNGAKSGVGIANGEIISKDDKSVTIKLRDGGSKIILLSGSTTINKNATGTAEDLVVGENVMASGTTNSDGSITAETVQLRGTSLIPGGQQFGSGENQPVPPTEQK